MSTFRTKTKKPKAYHHGNLKADLVSEALNILADRGAEDFSLRNLARRLKVSQTAVYRHFPNKDALLMSVAEEGFRLLSQTLQKGESTAAETAVEALLRQGAAYVQFACAFPAHYHVMFAVRKPSVPATASFEAAALGAYEHLRQAVRACADSGVLKSNSKVEEAALACWSIVHGAASLLVAGRLPGPTGLPQKSPAEWARTVSAQLLEGLIAQKHASKVRHARS